MQPEESKEIAAIRVLLSKIETLIVEVVAQKVALKMANDEVLDFLVEDTKKHIMDVSSEKFQWLRDTLFAAMLNNHPLPSLLPEWEREVQRLIESAKNIDLSE